MYGYLGNKRGKIMKPIKTESGERKSIERVKIYDNDNAVVVVEVWVNTKPPFLTFYFDHT